MKCDVCGSDMKEGDYGEARWICINLACEKSNPNWPIERLERKLSPLYEEMYILSHFKGGFIILHEGRWIGNGSAKVEFEDGTVIECYLIDGEIMPADEPRLTDEIKDRFKRLIDYQDKISRIMNKR